MTKENNIIIAEFMGYENINKTNQHPLYKIPNLGFYDSGNEEYVDTFTPYFDDMEFHSNWNWLMELVTKIYESLDLDSGSLTNLRETLWDVPNKEAVYNACLECIKEYSSTGKYICGDCGDHVSEVIFDEDRDNDFCSKCQQ